MLKNIMLCLGFCLILLPSVFALFTPPIITVDSPSSNQTFKDPFSLNVTLDELGNVWYSIDGGVTNNSLLSSNNISFTQTVSPTTSGNYNLTVYATDLFLNNNSTVIPFIFDKTPPNISILEPIQTQLNSSNFTFSVQLDEPTNQVWYEVNTTFNNTLDSINNTLFSNVVIFNDGYYPLTIFAEDLIGNINSTTLNLSVDATTPNVTLLSPANDALQGSSIVNLQASVFDTHLVNVTFYLDGLSVATNNSGLNGTYELSQDLIDGTYEWYVESFDSFGNRRVSETRNFTINLDTTPPSIDSITLSPDNYNTSVSFDVVATDLDGILFISYRLENDTINTSYVNLTSTDDDTWSGTINISNVSDGKYNVRFNVSDVLQNSVDEVINNVAFDKTTPIITNLTMIPPFPVYAQQILADSKNATINFSSSEFPLNFNFVLYVFSVIPVGAGPSEVVSSQNDLNTERFFPELTTEGTYTVRFNLTDHFGNGVLVYAGEIIIDATKPNVTSLSTSSPYIASNTGELFVNYTTDETNYTVLLELFYENNSLAQNYIKNTTATGNVNLGFNVSGNLSDGTYSVNFSILDFALNNVTYTLENITIENKDPTINIQMPTSNINSSKLAVPFIANFSEPITYLEYELNGHIINLTNEIQTDNIQTNITLDEYGFTNISLRFKDSYGRNGSSNYSFTTYLVISPLANFTDIDGDGIPNENDTIIGSEQNIYSNYYTNIQVMIGNNTNLSQMIEDEQWVTIQNNNETLIEFGNNFTNNSLNLTSVVVEFHNLSNNYSGLVIRGIPLMENETKTVYYTANRNSNNTNICIIDRPQLTIADFEYQGCNGTNMTLITSVPSTTNGYTASYTDGTNTTVKIEGLNHSAIQSICKENWVCSSYSACSLGSQSRTCTDTNACGTEALKPSEERSCTENSGSSSSGGGGSSGGFSSGNITSSQDATPITGNVVEESNDEADDNQDESASEEQVENELQEGREEEPSSTNSEPVTIKQLSEDICPGFGAVCSSTVIIVLFGGMAIFLTYRIIRGKHHYEHND